MIDGPSASAVGLPLAGLRVIDFSTVLAGPYCTMLLGDLGADVVKVEPPEGDATRGWGPPWVGSEADGTRTAAYYLAVNRNKRSIVLDLASEGGRSAARRLVARSDVLVENLRFGGMDRIGLDDPTLERLNPELVHLAISGYGRTGPNAATPGYDFVLQAEAGLMSITGFPETDGGSPTKVGVALADVVTGLHGAVAVLAALVGRGAPPAGGPHVGARRIDVSILAATLAVLVNQAQNAFVTGRSPGRLGNAHPNIVPYETFATADGAIAIAVGSERQWPRFCEALGLGELVRDPRFATNGARVTNRAALRPVLADRFAADASAAWLERLRVADVPCGPINDVLGAFKSAQGQAIEARVSVNHPVLGQVDQVRSAVDLDGLRPPVRRPPPILGEHTAEVLAELGVER